MKRALVPIANGIEEVEASSIITVLRRAGAQVTVASVEPALTVTGARDLKLVADTLITDETVQRTQFDGVFLPGGAKGAERFRDTATLVDILRAQAKRRALYGAICASPAVALAHHKLIHDKAVGHPSFYKQLVSASGKSLASSADDLQRGSRVVYDSENNVITSLGPGTALEFACGIVQLLFGIDKCNELAPGMCLNFTPSKL